ncbi:MAG TPA: diguanylate cyclase [Campylobacterales bacterium]|nr:diguanylate cyclase [Campylobacterales bacterium]
MHKILLVDDSKTICTFLSQKIIDTLDIMVDVAHSYAEAQEYVKKNPDYFLALLDVHLPDMNDTTMVDFMIDNDISSLVMTGDFNEDIFKTFSKRNIIDYVLKETPESLNYIVSLISRVYQNSMTKVLIVDDSITVRSQLKYFLNSQLFKVLSADEPLSALKIIEKNSDIKIIITDYNMPNLNGVEFLKVIRRNFSKNKIAVVGISTNEKNAISFLKYGANDFVNKPFFKEEFVCRINNTAEVLENVNKLEEIANIDFLTKVSNRKYFFEKAGIYFEEARSNNLPSAVAMIDIDNFKLVNDTYGHAVGDDVIKALAKILRDNIKGQDIVARFGGEEFVLYLKDITAEAALKFMQSMCQKISKLDIVLPTDQQINFTVSIGVSSQMHMTLNEQINSADELLYVAKNSGKNRVVSDLVLA